MKHIPQITLSTFSMARPVTALLSARSAFAPARLARRATRSPFLSASAAVRSPARVFAMAGFHDLSAKDIDGADVAFDRFKDKVVLVTNVASA